MAFVSTTPLFAKRSSFSSAKCPRMTVTSPPPAGVSQAGEQEEPTPTIPRYTKVPLKKGDMFPFVRFFKDDFEPSPYFKSLTGKGVRVAVLDTGCDPNHPALKGRIDTKASRNYGSGDPSDWSDDNGHGTHCAGIIAAEDRNTVMYGVAPGAELVIKKILPAGDIAQAIRDSVKEKCRVISMSFGYQNGRTLFSPQIADMYAAVNEALAAGVVLVAAAGNDGTSNTRNTIDPPGSFGGLITVAAHDDAGKRSRFSSYGGELDFMAPGEVISTYPGGVYQALQGTSMATPLIAGLCALLIEAGQRGLSADFSRPLIGDMLRTRFAARNAYEVREMIRLLSDRPDEHSRLDGYGALSRAYELVKGQVDSEM